MYWIESLCWFYLAIALVGWVYVIAPSVPEGWYKVTTHFLMNWTPVGLAFVCLYKHGFLGTLVPVICFVMVFFFAYTKKIPSSITYYCAATRFLGVPLSALFIIFV